MVKKKSCVILFTLLLTLLLGLLSNSYATTFSESELKNVLYNALTNFGRHDTDLVSNAIDNFDFSTYAEYTSNYDYCYLIRNIQENDLVSTANYEFYIGLTNDNTKKSMANYVYFDAYYYITFRNGVFSRGYGGGVVNRYIQQNGWDINSFRFNDLPLYNNTQGSTVTLTSGWHPSNIDDGIYNDLRFNFSYPNNSSFVTINNDIEPYEYCWISSGYQIPVGTLVDSWYTQEIKHNWATWNGSKYVYQHYTIDYNYDKHGVISNVYRNSIVSNNEWTTSFYYDTYNHANDILHIVITPKSRI